MNHDVKSLEDMRLDYASSPLSLADIHMDPLVQFEKWMNEALKAEVPEANAFTLATCGVNEQPLARIVLIKGIDDGILFYTNYKSQKGIQIAENPKVSACFFWQPLHRQVRIEGICEKVDNETSDNYFNKRPIDSRIGAITSPQSQKIDSREWLEMMVEANAIELGDSPTRPEYWGGYRIKPSRIEFWQGRPNRLHDRFRYTQNDGRWDIERLAP